MSSRTYYSPLTQERAQLFPRWSHVNNNILSIGHKFLNVHTLLTNELRLTIEGIYNQMAIGTANIDEVSETWIVEPIDIFEIPSEYNKETFLENVVKIEGHTPTYIFSMSGVPIESSGVVTTNIDLVADENIFYTHVPTAYASSVMYEGNEFDKYLNCVYNNGQLRIKLEDRFLEKRIDFPNTVDTFSDKAAFATSVAYDDLYERVTETTPYIGAMTHYYPKKDIIEDNMIISVELASQPSGYRFEESIEAHWVTSGYMAVGTSYNSDFYSVINLASYTTDLYVESLDFDNDGIINDSEIYMINRHFGKSKFDPNMTEEFWESNLSKFDIDGDGKITRNDIDTLRPHLYTTKFNTGNAIQFKIPGKYIVEYDSCQGGGVIGYIDSGSQTPYVWRNDSFNGQISTQLEDRYNDITYDYINDMFFFSDKFEKSIHAIIFNNNGQVIDKTKIILPVESFYDEPIGITFSGNGLLTTVMNDTQNMKSRLCIIDTFENDVDMSSRILPIFQKADKRSFIRELTYLSNDLHGITAYFGNVLIGTYGNKVLRFDPVYDIAFYSKETNRIHIREKFNEVWLYDKYGNIAKARPVWNRVWNEFDEFALMNGLTRLPGETNEEQKTRTLDVYKNYPHATEQGYINGIMRDLGFQKFDVYKNSVITVQNPILDITNPSNTFKVIIGWYSPINLNTQEITVTPVTNKQGVTLYNKYVVYGYHPYTNNYQELFTVDYNTISFNFKIKTEIQDVVRVSYSYSDSSAISQVTEEQFIINPTVDPEGVDYLEIFRMDDYERLSDPKYGFYDEQQNPTEKLYTFIKELRSIDNTTWSNIIANQSRFDTAPKFYMTNTKTPQYWQD